MTNQRTIENRVKSALWWLFGIQRHVFRKKSYLHTTGWYESFKRGYPCDLHGNELPWMNYPIIALLNERLTNDLTLFEYGSGYSTIYYGNRVCSVDSIEYDQNWLDRMREHLPENANVQYIEQDVDGKYCRAIHEYEQDFDVVVIDGRDRINCVKQAINKLTDRGVIILDDSHRKEYLPAIVHAEQCGFRALNVEGIKPTGGRIYRTTIIYRNGNCLGI